MFKRWRDKRKDNEQVRLASCPAKLAIFFCIPPLPLDLLMRVLELLGRGGVVGMISYGMGRSNKMVFSLRENFVGTLI